MAQARSVRGWTSSWLEIDRRVVYQSRLPDPRPTITHCSSLSCCQGPLCSKVARINLRNWGTRNLGRELAAIAEQEAHERFERYQRGRSSQTTA